MSPLLSIEAWLSHIPPSTPTTLAHIDSHCISSFQLQDRDSSELAIQARVSPVRKCRYNITSRKRKRSESPCATRSKQKRQEKVPLIQLDVNTMAPTRDLLTVRHMQSYQPTAMTNISNLQGYATPTSQRSSNPSDPSTNLSTEVSSRGLKPRKDPDNVKWLLHTHGMRQDDFALERYSHFAEKLKKILYADRTSAMKASSVQRTTITQQTYNTQNEATLTTNLLPLILKPCRSVEMQPKQDPKPPFESSLPVVEGPSLKPNLNDKVDRYFLDDGLLTFANKDFSRSLLPIKEMEKSPGLSTPRPDYIYGFHRGLFQLPFDTGPRCDISALLDVVHGMRFAFLIIEAKSDNGSLAEAVNQACRGGATLINTHRLLLAKTRPKDFVIEEGPDQDTFVFSCTMGPTTLDIYAHWAEVQHDGNIIYHMNHLAQHGLRSGGDALLSLRRHLHNILDWGIEIRLEALMSSQAGLCEAWEREKQSIDREKRHSRSGSPKKRQRILSSSDQQSERGG